MALDVVSQNALQRSRTADPDLDEVAVRSRDLVNLLDLWSGSDGSAETALVGMRREINKDERAQRQLDVVRVEHRGISADDAGAGQAAHTLIRGRNGQAYCGTALGIRQTVIGLE